ncbi:hypothetical protein E2C01_089073 [Portunus trituberculatus]|uniref:Uncharacterized protein n=1 Tax=Portunus trituberculatus TaxID=210409 RepID=A0A5B7JI46_PORTR|nr:hypothetical protein [Portunus trituberculatus]
MKIATLVYRGSRGRTSYYAIFPNTIPPPPPPSPPPRSPKNTSLRLLLQDAGSNPALARDSFEIMLC